VDPNATPRENRKARALLDRFDREANPGQAIPRSSARSKDANFAVGYAALTEGANFRNQVAPDPQWINLMLQSAQRAVAQNRSWPLPTPRWASRSRAKNADEAERHSAARSISIRAARRAPLDGDGLVRHRSRPPTACGARSPSTRPTGWCCRRWVCCTIAPHSTRRPPPPLKRRAASPDNVRVLANLAAAYHMLDRDDDAASTLQRAIEIEPAASVHESRHAALLPGPARRGGSAVRSG
jgi:hypothetical protein